ncbi:MAG: hypothetical protein KatS3mg124_1887 [Porticoccaceae bacterium]|nr:MAG: hypothetical protein KatS3mg124_1887 [Porticoccaceae bacterium]
MAYSRKLGLLFIHIPKCAGTSLIEALRKLDPEIEHGHTKWRDYERLGLKADHLLSFTVVRNPWDRVVSSYCYARLEESYWHGANKKWGIHPEYPVLKNLSFLDALELLYRERELLKRPEHERPFFRHHWTPQIDFLKNQKGEILVKHIFRYEALQELNDFLSRRWGVCLPHLNATSNRPLDYRDWYDRRCRTIVEEIYEQDIQAFQYEF